MRYLPKRIYVLAFKSHEQGECPPSNVFIFEYENILGGGFCALSTGEEKRIRDSTTTTAAAAAVTTM